MLQVLLKTSRYCDPVGLYSDTSAQYPVDRSCAPSVLHFLTQGYYHFAAYEYSQSPPPKDRKSIVDGIVLGHTLHVYS